MNIGTAFFFFSFLVAVFAVTSQKNQPLQGKNNIEDAEQKNQTILTKSTQHTKWNGLRVRYCSHPEKTFLHQPRLLAEAKEQGFKPVKGSKCNVEMYKLNLLDFVRVPKASPHYKGIAYAKDGDRALTLLFDIHGFIAGIQVGIPYVEGNPHYYPSQKLRPPFALDGPGNKHFIVTMYFTKPDTICSKGRKQADFVQHGTGDNLWLQMGQYPHTATLLPRQERQLGPPWVEGKCYNKMGKHYWYNISPKMDCKDFFPVFLMYNEGELTGFGWAFVGANLTSPLYEHADKAIFPLFFHKVPECLTSETMFSALHVYLTADPYALKC